MTNNDIFLPGQRLKLMAPESIKTKLQAILVGYRKKRYLVVERPKPAGTGLGMADGTRWLVNFVREGSIFTFNTQVMGMTTRPIPLIFLEYPKEIDRTSLRQCNRIPVNLPALLRQNGVSDDCPTAKGLIRDISEGGCQILTTRSYPIDAALDLTLVINDLKILENVTAEVKSHQDLGERHLLGLSFAPGRTSESYQKLLEFIEDLRKMPIRY